MKTVVLERQQEYPSKQGTPGLFHTDGFGCDSLELPSGNNEHNVSRILAGVYECKQTWSEKFGKNTYELQGVPGRFAIRIHSANFAGLEPEWQKEVDGCILLGVAGVKKNRAGTVQAGVFDSRKTVGEFESFMEHQPFMLEIKDAA